MILPPLPVPTYDAYFYTKEDMQAYGELCIKEYKSSVSKRQSHTKYDDGQVKCIRFLISEGLNYKQVNKTYPMSEVTFIRIKEHKGAYK